MKKFSKKIKNQKGYALLFTIMIISVITVITAGLINATTKQLILSSLAKDSQVAFYQADTAADCAFYFDLVEIEKEEGIVVDGNHWSCGGLDLIISGNLSKYKLATPQGGNSPCFNIEVNRDPLRETVVTATGYNTCNLSSPKVVQRKIEVTY